MKRYASHRKYRPFFKFWRERGCRPCTPLQRVSEVRVFREQRSEATETEKEDDWRLTNTTTNTKPDVVVIVSRPVVDTARRTAAVCEVVPRPAPQNTRPSFGRAGRVFLRAWFVVFFTVPVGAPLPDVAMHIVQAEQIGVVTADFTRTL